MTVGGRLRWILPGLAAVAFVACGGGQPAATDSEFFLPIGDPEMGRGAFAALRCHTCHVVERDAQMPAPVSAKRGPDIGEAQAGQSRERIAMSIMSPSHEIPPPRESSLSAMGNFREVMTVQQYIDLVAFISQTGDGSG